MKEAAKPQIRKAYDEPLIEWECLSLTDQHEFLAAYGTDSAISSRCQQIFVKADAFKTMLASALAAHQGALSFQAECIRDTLDERLPLTSRTKFAKMVVENRKVLSDSKALFQDLLWNSIITHDAMILTWLAEFIRKHKPATKSPLQKKRPAQIPAFEIESNSTLGAVILQEFVHLSGVGIHFIFSANMEAPSRLPTKGFLLEEVRKKWEALGKSGDNIDKDFYGHCKNLGLALPDSSKNPRWRK